MNSHEDSMSDYDQYHDKNAEKYNQTLISDSSDSTVKADGNR